MKKFFGSLNIIGIFLMLFLFGNCYYAYVSTLSQQEEPEVIYVPVPIPEPVPVPVPIPEPQEPIKKEPVIKHRDNQNQQERKRETPSKTDLRNNDSGRTSKSRSSR